MKTADNIEYFSQRARRAVRVDRTICGVNVGQTIYLKRNMQKRQID